MPDLSGVAARAFQHLQHWRPPKGPVGLAVSGGGDSVALLHMAADWRRAVDLDVLVFSVDHGLRPEAAGEAAMVADVSAQLGFSCEILRWRPNARVRPNQATARRARHALLAEALRRRGGRLLLTGHTLDDQLETFLIRARAGSGAYGLAGMSPLSVSPVWPEGRDVAIGRPLLGERRADLRTYLSARGGAWIEDPSNDDEHFERVRVRRFLASEPPIAARIERIMRRLAGLRALQDVAVGRALRETVDVDAHGLVQIEAGGLSPGRLARMLQISIAAAAGGDRLLDPGRSAALAAEVCSGGPAARITLGGAWIERAGPILRVARDPGAVDARAITSLQAGEVWDGRFERCETAVAEGRPARAEKDPGRPAPLARPSAPPPAAPVRCLIGGRIAAIASVLQGYIDVRGGQ